MKTNIIKLTLAIIISIAPFTSFSQEFVKNYEKTFSVNKNTKFKLSNKYGRVQIETNNSSKVEIKVTIETRTKNQKKADDIFDNISINFEENGNFISAITEIDGNIKNTEINYDVKMPETLFIELSNKYGHIFIDKLKSNSKISLGYGTLQINELLTSNADEKAILQIKYSNGTIEKCDYLDLDIKYSELDINESRYIDMTSGYCNLEFNNAYIIKAISKYDSRFRIKNITKFDLEGKYSKYRIDKLNNTLKANIKYSNIEIEHLDKDFENIFVNNKYGNVEIEVDKNASYKLNAKAEYGSISAKSKVYNTDDSNTKITSSFIGQDENSNSKITIITKYGNIEVE